MVSASRRVWWICVARGVRVGSVEVLERAEIWVMHCLMIRNGGGGGGGGEWEGGTHVFVSVGERGDALGDAGKRHCWRSAQGSADRELHGVDVMHGDKLLTFEVVQRVGVLVTQNGRRTALLNQATKLDTTPRYSERIHPALEIPAYIAMDALQSIYDGFIVSCLVWFYRFPRLTHTAQDYEGQKLAENLITIILTVSGVSTP